MKDRVFKTASQVFGVAIETLTEESSSDTIETWDSLGHMNFIMALEEELGLQFSENDVVKLTSLGAVLQVIKARV